MTTLSTHPPTTSTSTSPATTQSTSITSSSTTTDASSITYQCDCLDDQLCVLGRCLDRTDCLKEQSDPALNIQMDNCLPISDPNGKAPSRLEDWFTRELFDQLFPKANIGAGPDYCLPYNYESLMIAARYFPKFGTEAPDNGYSAIDNYFRDIATFVAHAIQETGENDASLYAMFGREHADACFYRGGLYNWFEGGPMSSFLNDTHFGEVPSDGVMCNANGRYCVSTRETDYFYPCNNDKTEAHAYRGCYFGRGAIQISYNYNYGQFQDWLKAQNIIVDLLKEPNLVMTKRDPPLAIMASLWFYMTPQPPKPAMHDIILGNWNAGQVNRDAGYTGPIFGPTSLIINNECNGEDAHTPGGPGESRRIKAFKWFSSYFGFALEKDEFLSCKGMPQRLEQVPHRLSYQPDWATTWIEKPCDCSPAEYGGLIPYYDPKFYPAEFAALNDANRQRCVKSIYANASIYYLSEEKSACLKVRPEFID